MLVPTNTMPTSTDLIMTPNSTDIDNDDSLKDESEMSPISLNDLSIDLSDMSVHLHYDMSLPNGYSTVSSAAEITHCIDNPILDRLDQLQSSGNLPTSSWTFNQRKNAKISIALNNELRINDHKFVIDDLSLKVVSRDVPDTLENCLPIKIYGDGNCLPRCGSVQRSEVNHLMKK